jgi:hypothetical protein
MIFYGRCPAVCVYASHLLYLRDGPRGLGELDHHFTGFDCKDEGIVTRADIDAYIRIAVILCGNGDLIKSVGILIFIVILLTMSVPPISCFFAMRDQAYWRY